VSKFAAGQAAPVSEAPGVPLHITFICSGNICRSPMAEKMFAHQISERGLARAVRVTSAGTGGWHAGEPADRRASHVLRAHGYPTSHAAAQIDDDHLSADLVVALGRNHVRILKDLGVEDGRVRMLRSFDPRSGAHALDVEDPYYGGHDDFEDVYTVIDASLPGLHQWVDEKLTGRGIAS
jgi:protein-tyrosine phosphatase